MPLLATLDNFAVSPMLSPVPRCTGSLAVFLWPVSKNIPMQRKFLFVAVCQSVQHVTYLEIGKRESKYVHCSPSSSNVGETQKRASCGRRQPLLGEVRDEKNRPISPSRVPPSLRGTPHHWRIQKRVLRDCTPRRCSPGKTFAKYEGTCWSPALRRHEQPFRRDNETPRDYPLLNIKRDKWHWPTTGNRKRSTKTDGKHKPLARAPRI